MVTPEPRRIGTWQEAEVNAAEWMRTWGYSDARALPGGPDKGLDVRAAHGVAQVKWRSGAVGRQALQQLAGAADPGVDLLFFAASNYSKAAVEFAELRGIALFVFGPWGEMEPINEVAVRVASRGTSNGRPGTAEDQQAVGDLKAHFARNWAAYVGGALLIGPFTSLGDGQVYTGPVWLDILKFVGILAGSWVAAAIFFGIHAHNRREQSRGWG